MRARNVGCTPPAVRRQLRKCVPEIFIQIILADSPEGMGNRDLI